MGKTKKGKVVALTRSEYVGKQARDKAEAHSKAGATKDTATRWSAAAERQEFTARFDDGRVETHWLEVPAEERRCVNTIINGPYKGQRCRKLALLGARVCLNHGAQLPQVKRAAQSRLLAAQDLAVRGVLYIAFEKPDVKDSDRLKAMQLLMDRGGLDAKQTIALEVKPYEAVMEKMLRGKKSKKGKGKGKVIDGELADVVSEETTFKHWEAPDEDD